MSVQETYNSFHNAWWASSQDFPPSERCSLSQGKKACICVCASYIYQSPSCNPSKSNKHWLLRRMLCWFNLCWCLSHMKFRKEARAASWPLSTAESSIFCSQIWSQSSLSGFSKMAKRFLGWWGFFLDYWGSETAAASAQWHSCLCNGQWDWKRKTPKIYPVIDCFGLFCG